MLAAGTAGLVGGISNLVEGRPEGETDSEQADSDETDSDGTDDRTQYPPGPEETDDTADEGDDREKPENG